LISKRALEFEMWKLTEFWE